MCFGGTSPQTQTLLALVLCLKLMPIKITDE